MKINICTINLNEEEGRQTIYLNTEDHLLYTDYDDTDCPSGPCYTIEEAADAAWSLWGKTPGWDLEWIERDEDPLWYALMTGPDDDDWGTGTYDREEAIARLHDMRSDYPDAYIAVIQESENPTCIDEIR